MVASVASLLDTVRSVNASATSVQTIETAVEAIKNNNCLIPPPLYETSKERSLDDCESPKETFFNDLIRATKGVSLATAKAVAAGNSGRQEDVVMAADLGRKYCADIMKVVKAAASGEESKFTKVALLDRGCCSYFDGKNAV